MIEDSAYIRVVLPLPLPKLYTYAVPGELLKDIQTGKRVEVQFGRRKLYAALVHSITERPEDIRQVKPVLSVLDKEPIIYLWQLQFWEWMAEYYMCTLGDVMQAALPSAFKLNSASTFMKNPAAEYEPDQLSGDEYMVCEAFEFQDELTLNDIQDILNKKSVINLIRGLIKKQVLYIREDLVQKYKPKTLPFVDLTDAYRDNNEELKALMDRLKRAPKQMDLLLAWLDAQMKGELPVKKSDLLVKAESSPAALKALRDKGVFDIEYKEVDRLRDEEIGTESNELEVDQARAFKEISTIFEQKNVALLHGITSSGKTHVYIELIKKYVSAGKQVLFLLPEIALTAQLIRRLRRWLGDIGVYHSKFNDSERIEIWNKVHDGKYKIVVGARSALFLPFKSLGLVVVDEEHDTSYKQYDPAPRYQARDSAIFLAGIHKAKVLLGSATPSYEAYYNTKAGKFGYSALKRRYGGIHPPEIRLADLQQARKRKQMQGALTPMLADAIQEVLEQKGQIILFQNRRGYAPYLACGECNWIPYCKNCDVSMTYHKFTEDLRCHYCGYREPLINTCRSCNTPNMELRGMGTERIEDDLKAMFQGARVGRMDLDAVRTKHGHEKIISRLEDGEIDILVGTRMVTKGLDFERVRLVGVLNADAHLYFPDFRAVERAYQTLLQVRGRSGRKHERGKVIIQMSDVKHPLVKYILDENGYDGLFKKEMLERQAFKYPPYVRLMTIILKHKDYRIVERAAQKVTMALRQQWGNRIIGPVKPVISRLKMMYIREITIKTERNTKSIGKVKVSIKNAIEDLHQYRDYNALRIYVDVDAY